MLWWLLFLFQLSNPLLSSLFFFSRVSTIYLTIFMSECTENSPPPSLETKKRKRDQQEPSRRNIPWTKVDTDILFRVLETSLPYQRREWEAVSEQFNKLRDGPQKRSCLAIKRKFEILGKGHMRGFLTQEQKMAKNILRKIEQRIFGESVSMVGNDEPDTEEDEIEELESDTPPDPDPSPSKR